MANCDINMERFAHDVCVKVLEKFNIFKAPDDTRKQNKYTSYDFLPRLSRLVVSYSIWIRDRFKSALEDKYKTSYPSNKEPWNFFYNYLLQNEMFTRRDCTGKVCMSLALCTEYIQFASTKDFSISLNKLAVGWNDFFEKNLRADFEAEGGFLMLHSYVKNFHMDQLDSFHKAFISKYCLPYGTGAYTEELIKKCAEKYDIPMDVVIFDIKTTDIIEGISAGIPEEQSEARLLKEYLSNLPRTAKLKREETRSETSDSEASNNNTETSEKAASEMSRNIGSEASDSEISQNNLLGIPPHEDMLREIDPFFVDNIPSPPKPEASSKSLESEKGSSDTPLSASKSKRRESSASDSSRSSPEQEEFQEKVEQILSKLEHDMDILRTLLFEHGLLPMKSGRRGSRMRIKDTKDKITPKSPEDLI